MATTSSSVATANDTITDSQGLDLLIGRLGADKLTGNAGADVLIAGGTSDDGN